MLVGSIQISHHAGHLFAAQVGARATLVVLLNALLHASHFNFNRPIVKSQLLVELAGFSKLLLVILKGSSQLLEIKRVLQLLLPC